MDEQPQRPPLIPSANGFGLEAEDDFAAGQFGPPTSSGMSCLGLFERHMAQAVKSDVRLLQYPEVTSSSLAAGAMAAWLHQRFRGLLTTPRASVPSKKARAPSSYLLSNKMIRGGGIS